MIHFSFDYFRLIIILDALSLWLAEKLNHLSVLISSPVSSLSIHLDEDHHFFFNANLLPYGVAMKRWAETLHTKRIAPNLTMSTELSSK